MPLFCTSAENNIGVARLMDFIAKYGSSPVDREKVTAHRRQRQGSRSGARTTPDPVCYVFKTMSEAQFGELSFFRVYSGRGQVRLGTCTTPTGARTEKIGQIYILNGKNRETVPTLGPGDIGAVVKLKDTHTGNTLCSAKQPVSLPKVVYPKPNIHAALEEHESRARRTKSRPAWRRCTTRTRRFFTSWMRNCTRPLSPRKASCTWK